MKIYVASSWRNVYQQMVVDALRHDGHKVYDFKNPAPGNDGFRWSDVDPDYKNWSPEAYSDALKHPVSVRGYGFDKAAMDWADTCVLVWPSGRSAHLEAGYMAGQGKYALLYIPEDEHPVDDPELMIKLLGADPVCTSIEQLLERLR